jgi:myo-inositol-1(or 4)-monophosphatase
MQAPRISLRRCLAVAREAALEAGALLRRNVTRHKTIDTKGCATNLVTDTDRAAERIVIRRLRRAFPDHGIVSEETAPINPGAPSQWYVDPLDGTTNFAHGFPVFGVSIGLAEGNRPLVGAACHPMFDFLFCAARGCGATLNGRRIRVSRTKDLAHALLATGFPFDAGRSPVNNLNHFAQFMKRGRAVRRAGCASFDICAVAAGWADGFWEMKLSPWDYAAGILLVEEAGGRVSDFDGGPCDFGGKKIVCSNGRIHGEMLDVLRESERKPIAIP